MMLYDVYEHLRRVTTPWTLGAKFVSDVLTHPNSAWSQLPGAAQWAAGYELMYRIGKEYEKPRFGIDHVVRDGVRYPVVEQEVLATPFCRLVRFKRFSDQTKGVEGMKKEPAVLVVAPLSGHHASLLRDTVQTLLQDHKVYITDWIDARLVPASAGAFSLDDYVRTVQQFIAHIGAHVHVMAVCQPVVPVLGAISLMSETKTPARSMILIGGPIDARQSPTAVNNLATRQPYEWFEHNVIHRVPVGYPGAGRQVYPGFLQHMGFVAMNPERHIKAHWDFYEDLVHGDDDDARTHRTFYDEYNAVLDMPAEYYLDTIKTVFQEYALAEGTWTVGGNLVRPEVIDGTALLTIEGARDDIAGQGQTKAAHQLCSGLPNTKKQHLLADVGHYGLFSGSKWRSQVYPKVRDFIAQHGG